MRLNLHTYSLTPTGDLGDLYAFDPAAAAWTNLTAGAAPPARSGHGFAAADGRLYVHGGQQGQGACTHLPLAGYAYTGRDAAIYAETYYLKRAVSGKPSVLCLCLYLYARACLISIHPRTHITAACV